MSYKEFESEKFTKQSQIEFTAYSEFIDCEFTGIDLQNYCFEHVKFIECRFNSCNLSNANFQYAVIRDARFNNCKLLGVNWTNLNSLFEINFYQCNLNLCIFNGLDLKSSSFKECICHQTDFSQGNFEKSDFQDSDLKDSSFAGANLQFANFERAKNYFIDLKEVRAKGAKFSFPEAAGLLEAQGLKVKF